jgi:uncharacterized membrane protein YbhN (UPF0104 family)
MPASHDSAPEPVGDAPTRIDPTTALPDDAAPSEESTPAAADVAAGSDPAPADEVQVIEEGVLGARLRRPLDLVRMMVALLLIAITVSFVWLAATTTADLDEDLLTASRRLPDIVVLLLNAVAGLGLLTLPVAVGIDMLIRRRGRQLFDAMLGLLFAVTVLTVASLVVEQAATDTLQIALAGSLSPSDDPFLPLFGGLVAFLTVARTLARQHWSAITVLVVVSLMVVSFISGGMTIAGIVLSLLVGWLCGLAVRYLLGTPTTRPTGESVAATLVRAGVEVAELRAEESTEFGRRYRATSRDGTLFHVVVLDRDLEGAGLASAMWRSLRLRTSAQDANVNMRRTLDQRALLSYAAQAAGVAAPQLVLASEVGPDSSLLVYSWLPGVRLSEMAPQDVTDDDLVSAFRTLAVLHDARIAHRGLSAGNLLRQPDGTVALLSLSGGIIAASDVASRIDIAELLATAAMIVGPERAVTAGETALGPEELARALPVLQKVALSRPTRRALREHKGLLTQLRDSLIEHSPGGAAEQIQLERVRPKTIITIILGSVAGYVLLTQLASVDLIGLFREADWGWAIFALLCSAITYYAAALTLIGFVPERLRVLPTTGAQLAASFATLVTPPTLGAVAINLRYLQRQGVHPALATASIGASQASAFFMHVLLLIGFGVAAGTQSDLTFEPPRAVVVGVAAGAAVSLGLLGIPAIRRRVTGRIRPLLRQIGPRLLTVVQRPRKFAEGIGGLVILNLAYIAALTGSVYAFGGDLNLAAIAIVYLTGSVVGQAAPTPGGLGAVEAAMAAGLTAAGLAGGLAVSAVLLFRLVTFWIPTVPGWFALNAMQRREML